MSAHAADWPSPEDAVTLPIDDLALRMLRRLVERDRPLHDRTSFLRELIKEAGEKGPSETMFMALKGEPGAEIHYGQALAEAWSWLLNNGLIAPVYAEVFGGLLPLDKDFFVTRLGHEAARRGDARAWLAAERRLGLQLHPRLEERVRRQFLLGEFELAAFAALREVEIAVRDAAGLSAAEYGTRLMNTAFNQEHGPLADPKAEPAEREAVNSLFRGAVGFWKNPSSHRPVEFADPTEAAEVILFADLLLHMVDRATTASAE
jgi:uncharacterized protein (TIGR02391 family)